MNPETALLLKDVHPYFWRSRTWHPEVSVEQALEVSENYEQEEVQDDGRMRRWGYVEALERHVRVVLLPDGKTLFNAFIDSGYKPDR